MQLCSTVLSFPLQTVSCFLAISGTILWLPESYGFRHNRMPVFFLSLFSKCSTILWLFPGTCSSSSWSHCPLWCHCASPEYWTWSREDLLLPGFGYHHQDLKRNHWNLGEFIFNGCRRCWSFFSSFFLAIILMFLFFLFRVMLVWSGLVTRSVPARRLCSTCWTSRPSPSDSSSSRCMTMAASTALRSSTSLRLPFRPGFWR